MNPIIAAIRKELNEKSDAKIQASSQRYFKESFQCYGMKSATVVAMSKEYFKVIKGKPKPEIFGLCDELWQSGYMEESFIACDWSYLIHKQYDPKDFEVFEKWVSSYVSNWASCDTLCNHTVGEFVEMYPAFVPELKRWATSENRWMRRAAAVSLIIPARKGKFLDEIFKIADILLLDKDDLVQKGYGWMLKAASQANQEAVFEYVMQKKNIMPRTSLRYAIEKMPKALKEKAMAK
ncbi:MAG: DNA alkylation repair protein [Bacteroidales bacterium]|nr:DNA alkylation repair protein [Bacteroidales bacterium]